MSEHVQIKLRLDAASNPEVFGSVKPVRRGRVVIKGGEASRIGSDKVGKKGDQPSHPTKVPDRRQKVNLVGCGRPQFPLPSVQKVVEDIGKLIAEGGVKVEEHHEEEKGEGFPEKKRRLGSVSPSSFGSDPIRRMASPTAAVPDGPSPAEDDGDWRLRSDANAQLVASEVLRLCFKEHTWRAAVAKKFNPARSILRRARKVHSQYQAVIDNLDEHYGKLRALYEAALPQVYDQLKAQNPDAGDGELRVAAVQLLDGQKELAQILYVLDRYVMAFEQREDPEYEPLKILVYTDEEAFNLFLTGNIDAAKADGEVVDTIDFSLGNRFLAYAGEDSLATLPRAHGPVGVNLLLVPDDEMFVSMLTMALNPHELYHDIRSDIKGLAEEEAAAVAGAIQDAVSSGQVRLSSETIDIGNTTLPLVDLITKLFLDNLEEIACDLVGGIEMCGWAYALCMRYTFVAYNSKADGVINTRERLRTDSVFKINKKGELWFEPHPVDYSRMRLLASTLELIGFGKEAQEVREKLDAAISFKTPDFITWEDVDEKREAIEIASSDLDQIAPVVAKAILMTPFAALKGKSHHDRIPFTAKR